MKTHLAYTRNSGAGPVDAKCGTWTNGLLTTVPAEVTCGTCQRMMKAEADFKDYYVEVTDTFGGEANYCWVARYKVHAKDEAHAAKKVALLRGDKIKLDGDFGDTVRYDVVRAAICYFSQWWDEDSHGQYSVQTLS